MSSTQRIPAGRMALAVSQARYMADVAERAVTLGDPLSTDSIEYAFAITPVPHSIDATDAATAAEVQAVRAIVRTALEVTR
jgi:hypothetical protein